MVYSISFLDKEEIEEDWIITIGSVEEFLRKAPSSISVWICGVLDNGREKSSILGIGKSRSYTINTLLTIIFDSKSRGIYS